MTTLMSENPMPSERCAAEGPTSESVAAGRALSSESGLDARELAQLSRALWNAVLECEQRVQPTRRRSERGEEFRGLLDWGQRMLPAHFCARPSAMHRWTAWLLRAMRTSRGRRVNIVGPRGSAKSTVVTLAGVLRAALEGWEPYIWIVSDTRDQACGHLSHLRQELLYNRRIRSRYGGALLECSPNGNKLCLTNGVVVEAYGTGQRIRGRRRGAHRPTWIICDDLEGDAEANSSTLREQLRRWFEGTLLKAGTKRTNVTVLGTAIHADGLAMRLTQATGWESRIFRSITKWPKVEALWNVWERIYSDRDDRERVANARTFFESHRAAMCAEAKVLWQGEQDLYTLMQMRVDGGRTSFEREMQGKALHPDDCEWPDDYFSDEIWFKSWPAEHQVTTIAVDPSKGVRDRRGDYSAIVVVARDHAGRLYVKADLQKRPTRELVETTVDWCEAYRPDAVGIEVNQFQELLADELTREMERRGIEELRPWTIENQVNKTVRIRRLGALLSSGRLRFLQGCAGTRLLVEQMRQFPAGDHDDGPDALEMAVRLIRGLDSERPSRELIGGRIHAR